jgi:hypothetical protein
MPDFDAIGTALAARFAAAAVTPPTGFGNIRLSTADLPNGVATLPTVLIFPDTGDFATGNGTRLGIQDWLVRFYYAQTGDLTRDTNALRKWLTVLVDQLRDSVQLGGVVVYARVDGWRVGQLTYAGQDYSGLELRVRVQTSEAWPAVA